MAEIIFNVCLLIFLKWFCGHLVVNYKMDVLKKVDDSS